MESITVRVWSYEKLHVQLTLRRWMTGRLSDSSQVLLLITPALLHWLPKPFSAGFGTRRIWFSVRDWSYVIVSSARRKNSMSAPTSLSVVSSGRRLRSPRLPKPGPEAATVRVSYCASNIGRPPAVPCEPRSLKELNACGAIHHGSSARFQYPENRPKVW